tara:strand:- start:1930 stop:4044 length:2115 start_codon:yes stop_codon:yes gene_type:complete
MQITKNKSIFVTLDKRLQDNCDSNNTILDKLEFYSKTQPTKKAFIELDNELNEANTITYKNLYDQSLKLAYKLNQLNLSNKQVLLIYNNDINFIVSFLACLACNIISVPVYIPKSNSHSDRLNAIIEDCDATAILTTTKLNKLIESKMNTSSNFKTTTIIPTDELLKHTRKKITPNINPENISFLQYTSGSTSTPKGVMVSHKNIIYNCKYIAHRAQMNQNSINLSWLPNYHDMGLFNGFLVLIYSGVTSIIMNPINFITKPINWLSTVSKYKVTHSGGPNFAYELCREKINQDDISKLDLSSWICAFNGAENIKASTLTKFTEQFKSANFKHKAHFPCYGLAETTLMVSSCKVSRNPVSEYLTNSGLKNNEAIITTKNSENKQEIISTGKVDFDTIVKIVNPKTNTECDTSTIGEIWVSGPTVTKGYWNKQDETEKIFKAKLKNDTQTNYLKTGDLGFLNHQQELFITGRIKEIIIINGKNFYPQDIENTIETASKDLMPHGTAAFQIEKNNNQKISVMIEVKRTKLKTINIEKTKSIIQEKIQKEFEFSLENIIFISPMSLPKTSSGKKQRLKAKSNFLSKNFKEIKDKTTEISKKTTPVKEILTYTENNVKNIVEKSLKVNNISVKTSLLNLGLNSLTSFEIISEINDFFVIEVSANDFFNADNISDVSKIIETKQVEALSNIQLTTDSLVETNTKELHLV